SGCKSLGITLLDYDLDGWPDLFVANDTQPNKLYRNGRKGVFEEVAVKAGLAFSEDGKARAGMGVDVGDYDNSGAFSLAVTNFDNEMMGLYHSAGNGIYTDQAMQSEVGRITRKSLGFGCFFFDADLDGMLDLLVVNRHIDDALAPMRGDAHYAQPPNLFLNAGGGRFRDIAGETDGGFAQPKVGRGAAFGDFDNDGDMDVLITTNNGPAYLYRNDQLGGNRFARFKLIGTESNRDAIGAAVRVSYGGQTSFRMVRGGGSSLSQSQLPRTVRIPTPHSISPLPIHSPH